MASTLLRSRISSFLSKTPKPNRTFSTSDAVSNPNRESIISSQSILADQASAAEQTAEKESIISSQTILAEQAAAAEKSEPSPETGPAAEKSGWRFLKYGVIGALTGGSVYAGYAFYAYTLDEVKEKTKALRESANYTAADNASAAEKYTGMLYSAAMTVPAKAVELYLDLRKLVEEQIEGFTEPTSDKLLPDLHPAEQHVFTLVLDLNETIIYSDWKRDRGWRTFKRPGVDDFLQHMAKFYEVIVYSDQLSMYVDPIVERLDGNHCIRYRLSRGATKYQDGKHYRDLSKLNRDPRKIIYVSANCFESCLQPENCVPIKPFKTDDKGEVATLDTALLDLIPFLEYVARASPADIRTVLASYEKKDIAKEFIERSKDYQKRMQEQRRQGRGSFWRR